MRISNESSWVGIKQKKFPQLKEELKCDVAVIGGGLAGVLTAYELAKAGKSVALLEAKQIGSGVTTYTTAFLMQDIDTDLPDLVKMYGPKNAKLIWESHQAGISRLEEIAENENIDCEFVRLPGYIYAIDEKEIEDLEETDKIARKLGFKTKLRKKTDFGFNNAGALEIPDQGKFHPTKFLHGLSARLEDYGVRVYENSEVEEIEIEDNGTFEVETAKGEITVKDVVVATYQPFNNPKKTWFKKGMYRSYVIEAQLSKNQIKQGIYIDLQNPYNYLRVDKVGTKYIAILGGRDHRDELKLNKQKAFNALEKYLQERLGSKKYIITRKWSSRILEPSDGLALIGEYAGNQYVATAFSGNGMTYSAITGMLIRDVIIKQKNPWTKIYDPKRVPNLYQLVKKGKDYTGEFIGGVIKKQAA